jgi:hypothetical protein
MPQLSQVQWAGLFLLKDCLLPFHSAQTALEGEKYATAGLVPLWIDQLRKHLITNTESEDTDLAEAAQRLLEDLDARWHTWPRSTLIAAALDFRTKYMGFFTKSERESAWEHIERDACEIYGVLNRKTTASDSNTTDVTPSVASETVFAGGYDVNPDADDLSTPLGEAESAIESVRERVRGEIKLYKKEPQIVQNADPLAHWRKKATQYPTLALVARKWLAVPASSAASERLFSSAGLTVTKKRTRLGTERVATLVFLKTAWPFLQAKGIMY